MSLKKLLLFLFVSVSVFHVSVYADNFIQRTPDLPPFCQNTTICGSAPKEFVMIMDFSRELLNTIKTIGTQGNYVGKYVDPNRFQGDTFAPPQQNILDKGYTDVVQHLDFLAATTAIFTSPQQGGGLKDLLAGITTLFKSDVFERDLKAVDAMDAAVTEKRYELGLAGGWYEQINDANKKKIQALLDQYKQKGLLSSDSIDNNVTYNNVTAMVGRIVTAMKAFLSFDNSNQFSSRSRGDGISIAFSGTMITDMQQQYSCARGSAVYSGGETVTNICDKKYAKFSNTMKTMGSDFSSSRNKSRATITGAVQRLSDALNGPRSFKPKTNIKNPITQVKAAVTGALQNRRSATQDSQKANTTTVDNLNASTVPTAPSATSNTFDGSMKQSMASLFTNQQTDIQIVNFSDVKDFSKMFSVLDQQIANAKRILGNRYTNGSLIKELGDACTSQCQNVGGTCRK